MNLQAHLTEAEISQLMILCGVMNDLAEVLDDPINNLKDPGRDRRAAAHLRRESQKLQKILNDKITIQNNA